MVDPVALVLALAGTALGYLIARAFAARAGEGGAKRSEGRADRPALPLSLTLIRKVVSILMKLDREYTLDELRAQAADSLGVDAGLTLRLSDEVTLTIPHPMFVDDDVIDGMQAMSDQNNPVEIAKLLLGDDYKVLRDHGGRSNDVVAAWSIMQKQMGDVLPGSGDPTQSGTS